MKCYHCGAELEADAKFCFSCGAKLEDAPAETALEVAPETAPVPVPVKKTDWQKWLRENYVWVSKLAVGTLLILIGLIRIFSAGTSISSTAFGADFYTYTYQGIVAITELLASIEVSLGWLIVAIGAWIDLSVLRK